MSGGGGLDLVVSAEGILYLPGWRARCALGRSGVVAEADKREGDGATPAGSFPLRRVLYRADRLGGVPVTALPTAPIEPDDAWCENPADPAYNTQIKLVAHAVRPRSDRLWREDHLYDLCVVLGHNDDPVRPGLGSGIFLHLARLDYSPTAGCIAVSQVDMGRILALVGPGSRLIVRQS